MCIWNLKTFIELFLVYKLRNFKTITFSQVDFIRNCFVDWYCFNLIKILLSKTSTITKIIILLF